MSLRSTQQYAINFEPQHRAYQNILLRPTSKYRSNLGICQNILGAWSLPEGVPFHRNAHRKIARRYRLVRVFVKQRRVWLWAELGTPPLRHYVKAELRLGTVRLQRCSMRTWLSNADATTPLTPVPCLPNASLIASSSVRLPYLLLTARVTLYSLETVVGQLNDISGL